MPSNRVWGVKLEWFAKSLRRQWCWSLSSLSDVTNSGVNRLRPMATSSFCSNHGLLKGETPPDFYLFFLNNDLSNSCQDVIPALKRYKQTDHWGLLASQRGVLWVQSRWETLCQNQGGQHLRNNTQHYPLACMCAHACTHTCAFFSPLWASVSLLTLS